MHRLRCSFAAALMGAAASAALAAECDEGQIIGQRPQQNARLVVCSTLAQRVPELETQVRRLTDIVAAGGDPAGDIRRFVREVNAASRRVQGRDEELAQSVAKLLSDRKADSDARLARELTLVAVKLEDLEEKIEARAGNPSTAERTQAALNGNLGRSIAELDLDTANQLVEGIAEIKKQLGDIASKADQSRRNAGDIRRAITCRQADTKALDAAVLQDDAPATLDLLSCDRRLLKDENVRFRIAAKFKSSEFVRNRGYLQELRAGGVDFVGELGPTDLNAAATHAEALLTTPLFLAASDNSADAVSWILAGSDRGTLGRYATLIDHLMALTYFSAFRPGERRRPFSAQDAQEIVSDLIAAGVPTDANDCGAFRAAYRQFLEASFPREGRTAEEVRMRFDDVVPFWKSMALSVAPRAPDRRKQLRERVAREFSAPRFLELDVAQTMLEQDFGRDFSIRQQGDEFIVTPKADKTDPARVRYVNAGVAKIQEQRKRLSDLIAADIAP